MMAAGRPGWWFTAAVLVLGAHLVGATTLARRPAPAPAVPEATIVELLPPEPTAGVAEIPNELTETLPALPQLAELQAPEFPDAEEPVEPPLPEPEPEPEPVEAEPVVEPVETIAAVRPRERPLKLRRPPPEPPEPQRERRKEPPKPPAEPRTEPRNQAPSQQQAARSPAGSAGQARASGQAVQSWENQVRQATARHMSRARVTARGQLSATVTVRIDAGGGAQATLTQGSGDAGVDSALMRHAGRMPRVPPPPDGQPKSIVVPFRITR